MRKLMSALFVSVVMFSTVNAQSYEATAQMGEKIKSYKFTQPASMKRVVKLVSDSSFTKTSIVINNDQGVVISKVSEDNFKVSGMITGSYNAVELSKLITEAAALKYSPLTIQYTAKKNSKPRKSSVHNTSNFAGIANRAENGVINMFKGDEFVCSYTLKDDLTWTKSTDQENQTGAAVIASPNVDLIKNIL